jgi:hypothetical protein
MPAYDPPNAFYSQISLPAHIKPEAYIGKEGCHLKRITSQSGCDYLWYDFKRGVIEIWGRESTLPRAKRILQKRINSFSETEAQEKPPLEPPEFHSEVVKISQVKDKYSVTYVLEGLESDCMKLYLTEILAEYPICGYTTNIVKKEPRRFTIKRSISCD